MLLRFLSAIFLACLAGCTSHYSAATRLNNAQVLANDSGWDSVRVGVPNFELMAFIPKDARSGDELTVYIEGDGLAWITPYRPSTNPTPINPMGLKLALAHPKGKAAYVGRPCQFVAARALGCEERYWTNERFSPEVVAAMSRAVDHLKGRMQASAVNLVGYSGGGAIAVLIAAQRGDVQRIVTVAGNLDTHQWTQWHGLGELSGSINPADLSMRVLQIPQWHFAGGRDSNIPPALVHGYAARFLEPNNVKVLVEDTFTHSCCWAENWAAIWARYIQ